MALSPPQVAAGVYPTPLSPPYPEISKDVEIRRALTAAAKSGGYSVATSDVVYEDEWLVVVNKPAGIYCEAVLASFTANSRAAGIEPEMHLANRLDRDTSGLMIVTKSHKVAGKLVKAFTDHKVKKTYLAFCIGHVPEWQTIKISSGHGRSKHGAWRVYSAADVGRTLPGGSMVRDMVTAFEVLYINGKGKFREPVSERLDESELVVVQDSAAWKADGVGLNNEVMVRAYPRSGRTHQIRLHCQYLGLPIRGDVKYGGLHEHTGITCEAHALHAESLSFEHPITGVQVMIRAPLPFWATEILERNDLEQLSS